MMIVTGCKFTHFLAIGAAAIPGVILLIIKSPYRLQRAITFLNPWEDASDTGWQIIQSLYAIGSGGLFGVGLGESKQKYLYIPEPHNDFIFSIIGEELGFIGCALIILLFAIFIWRGILIAMKAPDMFGSAVAVGITAQVGIQVIINIAVVTSSMPVTGMPLPFFSYRRNSIIHPTVPNGSIAQYLKSKCKMKTPPIGGNNESNYSCRRNGRTHKPRACNSKQNKKRTKRFKNPIYSEQQED